MKIIHELSLYDAVMISEDTANITRALKKFARYREPTDGMECFLRAIRRRAYELPTPSPSGDTQPWQAQHTKEEQERP